MLTTTLIALLAAPGVSPEALEAILRAQAAQASSSAYKVSHLTVLKEGAGEITATLVVVPPDRLHLFDSGVVPSQHVRVGSRAWMRFGDGAWEEELSPETLEALQGPRRADDWTAEVRVAETLAARRLGGGEALGYHYVLGWPQGSEEARMWVSASTGLPVRYEQDRDGDSLSWELEYDASLSVTVPHGETAPPPAAQRPFNAPRITLAVARAGQRVSVLRRPWPGVVVRGAEDLQVGALRLQGTAGLREALASLLGQGEDRQHLALFVDQEASWASVARVLDAAREAGVTGVRFGARSPFGGELTLSVALRGPATTTTAGPRLVPLMVRPASGNGPPPSFSLNGTVHSGEALAQRLRDVFGVRREHAVDVQADGQERFENVVALIDVLLSAGAEVTVTTDAARAFAPQAAPPPPPPPR